MSVDEVCQRAITDFWQGIDTLPLEELVECVERLASADTQQLKTFLTTAVNGLYPHMALFEANIDEYPDEEAYDAVIRLIELGADLYAMCDGRSITSMVIDVAASTEYINGFHDYNAISMWIDKLYRNDTCYGDYMMVAPFHDRKCREGIISAALRCENATEVFDIIDNNCFDITEAINDDPSSLYTVVAMPFTRNVGKLILRIAWFTPRLLDSSVFDLATSDEARDILTATSHFASLSTISTTMERITVTLEGLSKALYDEAAVMRDRGHHADSVHIQICLCHARFIRSCHNQLGELDLKIDSLLDLLDEQIGEYDF
jgi:hypothetical protein